MEDLLPQTYPRVPTELDVLRLIGIRLVVRRTERRVGEVHCSERIVGT